MRTYNLLAWILLLAGLATYAHADFAYLWCNDADQVYAVVDGVSGDVTLYHDAAIYNCCCEPATFEVSTDGNILTVTEIVQELIPCDCDCCFNLDVTVADLPPGTWTVVYAWFDRESGSQAQRLLTVVVPDLGASGNLSVTSENRSDCLASSSVPDDPDRATTWGTVKGLYR